MKKHAGMFKRGHKPFMPIMEKNGMYKHGLYAVEEKNGSIRKQLEKKCEICGNLIYEVHHKDGNNHNNELINLISVCRSCHMKLDNRMLNLKQYQTFKK